MAEFCKECLEELMKIDSSKYKIKLSKYLELCEGCAEYKHIVVSVKNHKIPFNFFNYWFKM